MYRRPCSKCGSVDYPKFIRVRYVNGKKAIYTSAHCVLCEKEDTDIRNIRRYDKAKTNPQLWKKLLERNKSWAKKNKEHIREYQRHYEIVNEDDIRRRKQDYYIANKKKILARNRLWKLKNRIPKTQDVNEKHVWRKYNAMIRKKPEEGGD